MLCARREIRGIAQKRIEAGPQTPREHADRPAKVRSRQGDPAKMSSSAPRGTLANASRSPSA
eukprot:1561686-Alexandrium_andersonii.AAC.1